jgi:hypothetical protein
MKNGTATASELAILASSCGLVENTSEGRQAFSAWLAKDQKAARKALFTRVAARRAQAPTHRPINAAEAQALRSGESTRYPQSWTQGRSLGAASVVRGSGLKPTRRQLGAPAAPRITEGND